MYVNLNGRLVRRVGHRYFAVAHPSEQSLAQRVASVSASGIRGNPFRRILEQGGRARVISNQSRR